MTNFPRPPRPAYTLLELVVVLAVIAMFGGIVSTTLTGQSGNTKVKAGADDATGLIALARSHAIEEGRSYRLSVSPDGAKLRVSPDDPAALDATDDVDAPNPFVSERALADEVTVLPIPTGTGVSAADPSGWVRLATFLQDGTCREDLIRFEIREPGVNPLVVEIRGLTGHATVNPAAATP